MEPIRDGYMMLLDELIVGGKTIGNISDEGIDWGGDKPTYKKLNAAQVHTGPVKKIQTSPGTNLFTFKMIHLLPENCVAVAGGTATGDKWEAPADVVTINAPASIKTGTGDMIDIKKVALNAVVRGKLGGDGNLYLDCEMEMIAPSDKSSPFSIGPTAPGVFVNMDMLNFPKEGGTKVIRVSASGAVTLSNPTGFTIGRDGNFLVITAAENSGSVAKAESLTIALASDATKKVTVTINQAK